MNPYRTVIVRIGITTLIFTIAAIFLFTGILKDMYLPVFPFLLLFYIILYLSFAISLISVARKKPAKFIHRFILFTGLKFFFLFVFVILYLMLDKSRAVPFLMIFLILYFGYSIATYSNILSKTNKNK